MAESDSKKIIFIGYSQDIYAVKEKIRDFVSKFNVVPVMQFECSIGKAAEENFIHNTNSAFIKISDEIWLFGKIPDNLIYIIKAALSYGKKIRFFSAIDYKEINAKEILFENENIDTNILRIELEQMMHESKNTDEIERKWLLERVPTDFPVIQQAIIEQNYISIDPEVRIRKKQISGICTTCYLDLKSSGQLKRKEISVPISEEKYKEISRMIMMKPIIKNWSLIQVNDEQLEISIVDPGTNNQFIYAEVEFDSEEDANNFVMPIKTVKEVTYDDTYKMKNYWKRTRT